MIRPLLGRTPLPLHRLPAVPSQMQSHMAWQPPPLGGRAIAFGMAAPLLPLPACGERVGVRGRAPRQRVCPEAQTRGYAPSPGICAKSAQIPTSFRKRREAWAAAKCENTTVRGGERSAASRRKGGDSASTYTPSPSFTAPPSPHPGLPSAVRPSPFGEGWPHVVLP
jgi:hypothetical protein